MSIRLSDRRLRHQLWLVAGLALMTASSALAQATSTFNGRILDQGDAVLPGVTVTVTNQNTGVVRTTVTNDEGLYFMPGLEPGLYRLSTDLTGFAPSTRDDVTLAINATITIDFTLGLSGVAEAITVTGAAPLIEVTQSKVASSIEATEIQNLPMITRTVSGMLTLLPGAAPVAELHRTKANVGTVSYGGSSGANVIPTVDGADNRDNHYGGPLMSFSTESLEQFQLATSQFTAADGRTGGAAVTMITKGGTNVLHGSAFVFARDRALTSKDYFTEQSNGEKAPFSRQQFGGSIGGPILQNKAFFFGAVEQWLEDTGQAVPDVQFNELEALATAMRAGMVPAGLVNPDHPRFGPQPGTLRMISIKSNIQLNNDHSLMARLATQRDTSEAVAWMTNNDMREEESSEITAQSGVVQHSWVMGNSKLNQITAQVNHMNFLGDSMSNITGEHYIRDFPNVDIFPPRLSFPTVVTGQGGAGGTMSNRYVIQIKEDFSAQIGTHSIKLGANYNDLQNLGIINANEHFASIFFFDDPTVILRNSNGRYPQGFQTPGIVRQWQQANGGAIDGQGYLLDTTTDARQFGTWFQDDWRITSNLTLNLGVRYDIDFNLMDQENHHRNATRHGAGGNRESIWRFPRNLEARHLAARGLRIRRIGRRRQGGARRLRPVLRSVQHRRRGGRHHLARPAPAERPRDAGEHRDRRRRAGHLPLRHRSVSATTHRDRGLVAAQFGRPVARPGHRGSQDPPDAHRVCAHAGGQYRDLGRLHTRRGPERDEADQSQSDRQRDARAGARFRPGLRRGERPQQREYQGGHQPFAV